MGSRSLGRNLSHHRMAGRKSSLAGRALSSNRHDAFDFERGEPSLGHRQVDGSGGRCGQAGDGAEVCAFDSPVMVCCALRGDCHRAVAGLSGVLPSVPFGCGLVGLDGRGGGGTSAYNRPAVEPCGRLSGCRDLLRTCLDGPGSDWTAFQAWGGIGHAESGMGGTLAIGYPGSSSPASVHVGEFSGAPLAGPGSRGLSGAGSGPVPTPGGGSGSGAASDCARTAR